ncbi:MAG: class II fumarate hydratase [Calditrichaeota bacterium]|nr:class II fumarate hydratase [Candidatus Cloacimonadota bacterium]MCB1047567.1 class II fumarate hydratase [Calditrichota bacterium]
MNEFRLEHDSMGEVRVPADVYWGAQTQRSIEHFPIGRERFRWPRSVIRAFALVKGAAARANAELGQLDKELAKAISGAAAEVESGRWDTQFPLVVFQTGSGTQSNMNANEVLANLANERLGHALGSPGPVHPNDHVNRGQSSNDVFPTVMHVAVLGELQERLLPALTGLKKTFGALATEHALLVKTGRTHLQDATPITLGQEVGAWAAQLSLALDALDSARPGVLQLALGGTAVGTGLNAHPGFAEAVIQDLARITGLPLRQAPNLFAALAGHEPLLQLSAALRTTAAALLKIANDIRWLASGPRCGIGELRLPENEPGSSIMPGKVNPTQCEALSMVCVQVYGNDAALAFAASQGNFQLNVYKPVILHNVLESIGLLADACAAFDTHCARGIEPDRARIADLLERNLMRVTALAPRIGYERAAALAHSASLRGLSLLEVALEDSSLDPDDLARWLDPARQALPNRKTDDDDSR